LGGRQDHPCGKHRGSAEAGQAHHARTGQAPFPTGGQCSFTVAGS
jgi:hypothetical protein